ncbi:uncharacterized protein MEPE_02723 [Melanopsichium pennsylvanicum]|uniref:Uncharacterized protein n=1 Tax=Melanopsichium pennsylvanicum TaxID=63383 RepID=A0AAJ5C4T9_9BASI|nr:uncharacterized protein MEPE_02723 [Melanopsichium pennsylvanicum]
MPQAQAKPQIAWSRADKPVNHADATVRPAIHVAESGSINDSHGVHQEARHRRTSRQTSMWLGHATFLKSKQNIETQNPFA